MSLNFGNKEYRNLVEQVAKNMQDIQDIQQGATVLADFGIKIVGEVESSTDLPDPATYEGEYGDAYLVGTEEPYEYYIFTRAFEGQDEPSWFDLGIFPVPGPAGQTGAQGEPGPTPDISMVAGTVSTLNPGQSATATITQSGTDANPIFTINFGIPQGAQGLKGDTGERGLQGEPGVPGEKGDKGDTGGLIEVVGIVASAESLPNPVTLDKLDAAYLVGTSSANYHLYIQIGETTASAIWTDVGLFNVGTVVTESGSPVQTFDADTKLDVTTTQTDVLYAEKTTGTDYIPFGTTVASGSIPQRDSNGQITVPQTPTDNSHAASKLYVDDSVAEVLPTQYAGDLIVGTGSHTATRLAKGSAGQVLTMNSAGTAPEWATSTADPGAIFVDFTVNSSGVTTLSTTTLGQIAGFVRKDYSTTKPCILRVKDYQQNDYEFLFPYSTNSDRTKVECWGRPFFASYSTGGTGRNLQCIAIRQVTLEISNNQVTYDAYQYNSDQCVIPIGSSSTLSENAYYALGLDGNGADPTQIVEAYVSSSYPHEYFFYHENVVEGSQGTVVYYSAPVVTSSGVSMWKMTIDKSTKAITYNQVSFSGGSGSVDWDDITNKPTFATVATTGDYDDLIDKPTIPDVSHMVTDNTAQTISEIKTFTATPVVKSPGSATYGIRLCPTVGTSAYTADKHVAAEEDVVRLNYTGQVVQKALTFQGSNPMVVLKQPTSGSGSSIRPTLQLQGTSGNEAGYFQFHPTNNQVVFGCSEKETPGVQLALRTYQDGGVAYSALLPTTTDKTTAFGTGNVTLPLGLAVTRDMNGTTLTTPVTAKATPDGCIDITDLLDAYFGRV